MLTSRGIEPTDDKICELVAGTATSEWQLLRAGIDAAPRCHHLIEYDDIVNRPRDVLAGVYRFLDLEPFTSHQLDKLEALPERDEQVYRMPGLHRVRAKLARSSPPAREVLGARLFDMWSGRGFEFWR